MKKFLVLALAAVSASAFAEVKVGDTATLVGIVAELGSEKVSVKNTVIAVNAAAETATVRSEVFKNGTLLGTSDEEQEMSGLDPAATAYVVANCTTIGGTPMKLSVPAGVLDTCKILDDTGSAEMYIASVPFGTAKIEVRDSAGKVLTSLELESFASGL